MNSAGDGSSGKPATAIRVRVKHKTDQRIRDKHVFSTMASAIVENTCKRIYTSPYIFIAWCLFKQRESFSFYGV